MTVSDRAALPFRRQGGPGVSFPPTLLFIVGFLAALWAHSGTPLYISGPTRDDWRLPLGLMATAVGIALFLWALRTMAAARTGIMLQHAARCVVATGPYAWSRNPMYVAFVTTYVGIAILANSVWPLVVLPAIVGLLQWLVIRREEKYLVRTFGEDYMAYCRRVRRWV